MQLEIIAAMMQRRGEMLRLQEEKVEEEGKATCRAANPNCMPASMRRQRCYRPGLKQQHHTAATQMGGILLHLEPCVCGRRVGLAIEHLHTMSDCSRTLAHTWTHHFAVIKCVV